MSTSETSRRNVLSGLAAAGVAVPVLAACGNAGSSDATGEPADPGTPAGSGSGSGTGSGGAAAGTGLSTADIPVGGGKVFPDEQLVVTQPSAGEFKAFSAVCTHQGCLVSQVADGSIVCPCHGSMFSIKDGSVEQGPASSSLPERKITVSGGSLAVS